MDVSEVISRLAKVRPMGRGKWIACCPAHADKTPSLTIRECDDGRILMHDFGGCDIGAICDAIGVSVSDLFAQPLYHRAKAIPHPFTAQDALRALRREAGVVALYSADVASGYALKDDDRERLAAAADRIASAAEYVDALR